MAENIAIHFKTAKWEDLKKVLDAVGLSVESEQWQYPRDGEPSVSIYPYDELLNEYEDADIDRLFKLVADFPSSTLCIELRRSQGNRAIDAAKEISVLLLTQFEGIELDTGMPDHEVTGGWPKKYEHVFRRIREGQKLCNVRHADTSVYTWEISEVFGPVSEREVAVLETISRHRRHKRYGDIPNGNPLAVGDIETLSVLSDIRSEITSLMDKGYLKDIAGKYDLKGAMFCSGLFKRPRWDEPSPTVLTNFHNPRYFLHPKRNRPFSLRECARLQSFPDDFRFTSDKVTLVDGYRLVGNAVPPRLSVVRAEAVSRFLAIKGKVTVVL